MIDLKALKKKEANIKKNLKPVITLLVASSDAKFVFWVVASNASYSWGTSILSSLWKCCPICNSNYLT